MTIVQENLDQIMTECLSIAGATGVAVGDADSGMCLGQKGDPGFSLDVAVAVNTEVVRAKKGAMRSLKISDQIEDILITLGREYHLIRLIENSSGLFIYLVLDRAKANLAMARHNLKDLEKSFGTF